MPFIGIANIVCEARSMKLSTVLCPSICLVCPIQLPHATAASLLLWARRAGDVNLLLHRRHAVSECVQRHTVSVCNRLVYD